MRSIDYREINPQAAFQLTYEDALDMSLDCNAASDYANDYMSGAIVGMDDIDAAQSTVHALRERKAELENTLSVLESGPSMSDGNPDRDYLLTAIAAATDELWIAIEAWQSLMP